jgi:predicted esterase
LPTRNIQPAACSSRDIILLVMCLFTGLFIAQVTSAEDKVDRNDLHLELTPNQLMGEQEADRFKGILDPQEPLSWEVYLPDNGSTETPGVLVYVSPRASGQIDPHWKGVMDAHNLIYIAANNSGNRVPTAQRMVMATMAIRALGQNHAFTAERIYVSGFSGGGRVASRLASQYPQVFTGAVYICGVDFWRDRQTPHVDRLLQNRFVFLTGSKDFNRKETGKVYRKYLKAGATQSKLMVIPGMRHQHPDAENMSAALQFLDGMQN